MEKQAEWKKANVTALMFLPYLCAAIFIAAVITRFLRIATMPVHLRWELYPVGHEANRHGGSYLEHPDWWKRERKPNRVRELEVMAREILLLDGVREHNRSLWWRTYPFHGGLYLSAAFLALLAIGAALEASGYRVTNASDGLGAALSAGTISVGLAAMVLLALGSAGLLFRRAADPALRTHSALADYANLVFFLATACSVLLAVATADGDFAMLRAFLAATLAFRPSTDVPPMVAIEIVLGSLLVAYIPLTHMSHFFTKWFTYHHVRWNDRVNRPGSRLEASLVKQLAYPVRWSAPHIQGDGKKTWVDVATQATREEPKP